MNPAPTLLSLKEMVRSGRLAKMLGDGEPWASLDIDYDRPRVKRLWRQVGEHRLCLHEILPCEPGESFFHPHPWPSAMAVLSGGYVMDVGFGAGVEPPAIAATLELAEGSTYEMAHPDSWHSVRPPTHPSLSIVLTGRPWRRQMPRAPEQPQRPLEGADADRILSRCRDALALVDFKIAR